MLGDMARVRAEDVLADAQKNGFARLKMHAQAHLEDFYARHGFRTRGEVFAEDLTGVYVDTDDRAAVGAGNPDVGNIFLSRTGGSSWS